MIQFLIILLGAFLFLGFPMFVVIALPAVSSILIYLRELSAFGFVHKMLSGITPFPLIAVPLFIFAADVMLEGELSDRLINFAKKFVGHFHGGLAHTLTLSCIFFGAVSGSTQATVAAIGGNMYPALRKSGYKDSFVLGLIVNASDVSLLIPPSILMIIYGVITGASIGALFLAGVFPGILLGLAFMAYSSWWARKHEVPLLPRAKLSEILGATKRAAWPLGLPFIIIGGIYSGIVSPTEAAGVSVVYAIFVEIVIYKSLKVKDIYRIALKSGTTTAIVFILVAGAAGLSWLLTFAKIPQHIGQAILGVNPSPIFLLFAMNFVFFVALMFFAPIPAVVILTPLFYPIAMTYNISPVHLGVVITLNCALGSATPPFGVDIFTATAIFRVPFWTVVKGVPPFVILGVITLIIITLFPKISLFLPSLAF